MKLAIMQPYIFPYVGYFQLVDAVDSFIIYDDAAFIKQGWINRNYILLNGKKYLFSIPLADQSSYASVNSITISATPYKWDIKLLDTIRHAYYKAPYFEEVYPLITAVLKEIKGEKIAVIARQSIETVLAYLGIRKPVIDSSTIEYDKDLSAQEKIILLCRNQGAATYINMIGGQALYDRSFFDKNGIDLGFLQPGLQPYKQYSNDFIASLSIIDVLMFNSKEEVIKMISNYTLS